jgi:ferredoxin
MIKSPPLRLSLLEKALRPFEKELKAQEKFRRRIGVRQVDTPTYHRYLTGPVERFDSRRYVMLRIHPDNPYADGFPERFKEKTGYASYADRLPPDELSRESRIASSLVTAAMRIGRHYEPHPLSLPSPESRVEVDSPEEMSGLVKKVALFLGGELVGITRLDQRWVYKDKKVSEKYAIVVAVTHRLNFMKTAPSFASQVAVGDVYSRLKYITSQLSDFICGLGYPAFYRETLHFNPELLMVPLAIDAGIGEFCRTGGVLSPEYGINIRLKAVTTDLPLQIDKPISFGVHEFCMACDNCARACPPRAIPFGPATDEIANISHNPGFKKWFMDAEKCLTFWAADKKKWTQCGGRCIPPCPWNQAPKSGVPSPGGTIS